MDPALALPSYRVYRGSLAALLIGSIFAIWLLVLPPAGADRDAPPSSLAAVLPTQVVATATVFPTASASGTAGVVVPTASPATGSSTPTATATPAATPTATATAPSGPQQYTVQPGDTLYAIAQKFLPPGVDINSFVNEIQQANNITDPGSIAIGDTLDIPRS